MRGEPSAMTCPSCREELVREVIVGGSLPTCPRCAGSVVTVGLLRRIAPKKRVQEIWYSATKGGRESKRRCPSCRFEMRVGGITVEDELVEIDACRRCQLLWFDGTEFETFSPERQEPDPDAPDPSAESHARWMAEHRRQMHERLEKTIERTRHHGGFGGPL